jgi:hypothetical protein
MSDTVRVATIPDCDIHKGAGQKVPAAYDLKLKQGPWAYVCEECRTEHAFYKDLGTGKGQRLTTEEPEPTDEEAKRKEMESALRRGDFDAVQDLIGDGDLAEWL